MDSGQSFVLICLDSVRKDYFDKFAPRLKNLSDVDIHNCRAASSWTVPSYASMFTGLLPHEHGVHAHSPNFEKISGPALTEAFKSYRKVCISANGWISPEFGLNSFFDTVHEIDPYRRYPGGLDVREYMASFSIGSVPKFLNDVVHHEESLTSLRNGIDALIYYISKETPFIPKLMDDSASENIAKMKSEIETSSKPFFMFLNLMDAHIPLEPSIHLSKKLYNVPNSWSTSDVDLWVLMGDSSEDSKLFDKDTYWQYRLELYGAVIDYIDRIVFDAISTILERNEDITFVITADHGENIGTKIDEYKVNHVSSLSEGLLHVPLVIINPPSPDCFEQGPPEDRYFSHLKVPDMFKAMRDGKNTRRLFNQSAPAELIGLGSSPEPPGNKRYWNRMIRAIYKGNHKFEWDSCGGNYLYEVDFKRNNWQREIEFKTEHTSSEKEKFFKDDIESYKSIFSNENNYDISPSKRQHLKELGYMD